MKIGDNGVAGTVYFNTAFDTKSYNRNISSTLSSTENAFSKTFKKIGKIVGLALSVTAITAFTKSCLDLGSDLAEVQNVVDVTFPNMSNKVNAFAKNAINQFGLSEKAAKQYMGTFGAMSKSFGFSEESAYNMSASITGLVGDISSFYNISQDLAAVKLKAIWSGETEGLKDLGVVMTQTALQEYALQKGISKTISDMSEAEKVALRYSFVQDKLALATGDFARTSDGWANQTRILTLRFDQLKATLGQGFIALFTPIIKGINTILAGLQKVASVFSSLMTKLFGKQADTVSNVSDSFLSMGASAVDASNETVSASKKAQKAIMGYDKLNILSTKKDSNSGSGNSSTIPSISDNTLITPTVEDNTSPAIDAIGDKILSIFNKIKTKSLEVWNSDAIQSFVNFTKKDFEFLFKYIGTLGNNLKSNLGNTWANIRTDFENSTNNMSYLWTNFWQTASENLEIWGQPIIEGVSELFNSIWIDAIDPAIQFISGAWSDFSSILVDLWDEHGAPLLNNIGEFATKTISLFQKIWDDVLEPIITPFLETLSWLWDEYISKLVKSVGDFIGTLINDALEIYNKFIQPLISFLLDKLSPAWSFISSFIIGTFGTAFAFLSDTASSILKIFTGIIDFITGIFTGNWKKAWNGIVSIFKGIIDGLAGIFKTPINFIIDGLNAFIKGLNKIKIPDWDFLGNLAGKGFNIPTIPKLAEGAWFKARNPRLAIVGEGKENEIVAPESKIEDAVEKGNKKNNDTRKLIIELHITTDDGRKIIQKINDTQIEEGKILLNI